MLVIGTKFPVASSLTQSKSKNAYLAPMPSRPWACHLSDLISYCSFHPHWAGPLPHQPCPLGLCAHPSGRPTHLPCVKASSCWRSFIVSFPSFILYHRTSAIGHPVYLIVVAGTMSLALNLTCKGFPISPCSCLWLWAYHWPALPSHVLSRGCLHTPSSHSCSLFLGIWPPAPLPTGLSLLLLGCQWPSPRAKPNGYSSALICSLPYHCLCPGGH